MLKETLSRVSLLKYALALIFCFTAVANLSFAEVNASNQSVVNASTHATINVNQADAKALAEQLFGVGPKKAEAIVAFRDLHGPFLAVEEMTQVKGLGKAFVEKNRSRIVFE